MSYDLMQARAERDAALLKVDALKKFVEAYGHIEGHSENCVCAPCEAWDEAKCLLEHGPNCADKRKCVSDCRIQKDGHDGPCF